MGSRACGAFRTLGLVCNSASGSGKRVFMGLLGVPLLGCFLGVKGCWV